MYDLQVHFATALITTTALTGCAYHAGSFADGLGNFPGSRIARGCLDLAVGSGDLHPTGPVVAYSFGNRCDRRVTVDLASVRARGREVDGSERDLVPYDPNAELRALPLNARGSGREQIEYRAPASDQFASVCVDVGDIDHATPGVESWICIDQPLASGGIAEARLEDGR